MQAFPYSELRRGGTIAAVCCVAPFGARNSCDRVPTAHAVGYQVPPLRGSEPAHPERFFVGAGQRPARNDSAQAIRQRTRQNAPAPANHPGITARPATSSVESAVNNRRSTVFVGARRASPGTPVHARSDVCAHAHACEVAKQRNRIAPSVSWGSSCAEYQ